MASRVPPARTGEHVAQASDAGWRLLQAAARLLLEFNERSALIAQHVDRLASRLGVVVSTAVAYRVVTLATPDGRVFRAQAPELRVDMAVSIETLRTIDDFCADRIDVDEGIRRLAAAERTAVRHGGFAVAAFAALAASALAATLGADGAAIASSGASAALGLTARRALARRARTRTVLGPFVAALVGALAGALVIRAGWTQTQSLCLVVPALILVPGPHLINSVQDLLENEIEPGLARLCLAIVILLAAALGVIAGASLIIGATPVPASAARAPVGALSGLALAGAASAGFGVLQNAPWRVVWVATACGALGYAIRAASLALGAGLAAASLPACLAIGIAAGLASARLHLPFAAAAFAGAAPLMPGVSMYQSIAAAMRLAAAGATADPALAVAMLSPLVEAALVVAAMVVGLVAGDRIAGLVRPKRARASW
jgi:uncharacterized membrane protein YjjP (DUF1212 family)